MILLLDSSTPELRVVIVHDDEQHAYVWQADRQLAKGLLAYLEQCLQAHDGGFQSLKGIVVFEGPGSFTGLRIGMTVANTLAQSLNIPIVATRSDAWRERAIERLNLGENDRLVVPYYGSEARITTPRK